jgi:hypothetical protein
MAEPVFRKVFDAGALWREHPPRVREVRKSVLLDMAYPAGVVPAGTVEVTQWAESRAETLGFGSRTEIELRPDFFDYAPSADGVTEWHLNFADARLFCAYGSRLFAQDEMQVAEHPLLACVREALLAEGMSTLTYDEHGATPILVRNVARMLAIATNADAAAGRPAGLYGNAFAAAPVAAIRQATRRIEPPTMSNIIAMAAPSGGHDEYTPFEIGFIFRTALTAFAAARQESQRAGGPACGTRIHTGFWGCGAFGGDRTMMIALQALAARVAGLEQLVLHTGDQAGIEDARRGIEAADGFTAGREAQPVGLEALVTHFKRLGLRWGYSDGN